jgi:P4 family phage/plasmid primase-like protien
MYKRIDIEIENLIDDEKFEKCLEDERYLSDLIKQEVDHLDNVINYNIDYILLKSSNYKFTYRHFHSLSIHDCDKDGNILDKSIKNRKENNNKILAAKFKIIEKYFISKHVHINRLIQDKNIIIFSCPICGKSNGKCFINSINFKIGTFSQSDCTDDIHDKVFTKMQKELKKMWDNSQEKKELVFSMNIDYISNIIRTKFPKIVRYNNSLYYYKELFYVEMTDNEEKSDLERFIYDHFFCDNDNILTKKQLNDVKNFIKKNYKFDVKELEDSNLVNCKNGVLDINKGELSIHSDKYFFTYILDIDYRSDCKSDFLNDFLNQIGVEKDTLCKILGHIHFQGNKLQKGYIFKGTKQGRNGKGTLVKLIQGVIKRSVTMSLQTLTESNFATYELKDKQLYIEDDFKMSYIDDKTIGLLNRMISKANDVIQQKNKPAITIEHTVTPILQCNKLPKLKAEDDGGFYKRFYIVNFEHEFGDKMDEFLGDKLLKDNDVMSSMLNYLIIGYKELMYRKENNITTPFFAENNYIEDWKKENNSAFQFVDEECIVSNDYEISSRELYKEYRDNWNLGSFKMSESKFIKEIKEHYKLNSIRKRANNMRSMFLIGLKLNNNDLRIVK